MLDFVQQSFKAGMNLLADDTRLQADQYRLGFNVRNRYDVIEGVLESQEDIAAPPGLKQECVTFGNYVVLFVAGSAYYRYFSASGWTQIVGFQMSAAAPRYWTVAVPISTTNYGRFALPVSSTVNQPSANAGITLNGVASAFGGNIPGLLVQDNINQPQFIFLDANGVPTVRVTQNYAQWSVTYNDDLVMTADNREYVPIGNAMEWVDGVLYITSQDFNFLYRSVSGRPLDFVVNVDLDGNKGGDATTTSYSVGVGGITALRAMANNALLVTANNAVFAVSKNTDPSAMTIFGEYTFIRTFLFNSTCLSDRAIIDSLGDTKFISPGGVRSFNAVMQQQNEGRNSLFSAMLQAAFSITLPAPATLIQLAGSSAAILYDNYELYALNTIFGPAIAVYDTINGCWTSFDISQVSGRYIKMFAKIELTIQRLYAITDDNKLYTLYLGPDTDVKYVRPISMCSSNVVGGDDPVNPAMELKLSTGRAVFNKVTAPFDVTVTPFVNNRLSMSGAVTKSVPYSAPTIPYTGTPAMPDVDTGLANTYFSFPNAEQGWKTFFLISWTGPSVLTQFIFSFTPQSPMNPLNSQS